jgi:hypothetical protein
MYTYTNICYHSILRMYRTRDLHVHVRVTRQLPKCEGPKARLAQGPVVCISFGDE